MELSDKLRAMLDQGLTPEQLGQLLQEAFRAGRKPGSIADQHLQATLDQRTYISIDAGTPAPLLEAADCAELEGTYFTWHMGQVRLHTVDKVLGQYPHDGLFKQNQNPSKYEQFDSTGYEKKLISEIQLSPKRYDKY